MYNYILIILYGISDIFSPKKFALLRNLTSIFQKIRSLIFLNKQARYLFIKRIENLEVETIHTATNTPKHPIFPPIQSIEY